METVWDVKESLKHETLFEKRLSDSIEKWKDICETFSTDVSNVTNSGLEWKVRYECQKLYNQMIMKQIQRMRAELRMLRCGVELSPYTQNEKESVGELRTRIRNLRIEKCSMKSLRSMYERQLDMEAMAYFRARGELEQLTKDVRNTQVAWVRDQERTDRELMTSLEVSNRRKLLKPIAKIFPIKMSPAQARKNNVSYTNMFLQHRGIMRPEQESNLMNQHILEEIVERRGINGGEDN